MLGKFLLRKFHLGKCLRENSSYWKFLIWKIPPMDNSSYEKFLLWKIHPMENSTYGKFHLWKIPPTENLIIPFFFSQNFSMLKKQCSRQFWNAVERKPVKTRVLNPTASEASYIPKQRSYRKTKQHFFFLF